MSVASPQTIDGRRPEMRCYEIGVETPPVARVAPGEEIRLVTLDASGGQIAALDGRPVVFDPAAVAPLTGPVEVAGVEAGDAVGIELLSVEPAAHPGYLWTRPTLGQPRDPKYAQSGAREVDLATLAIDWLGGRTIAVPRMHHVGTLGVAPAETQSGNALGAYGGNLDCRYVRPGATLWLTAQVAGGMVFAGDAHAAIGAGEICGTGVEMAATIALRVHHRRDWAPPLPTVVDDAGVWVLGFGDTLDDAFALAVRQVLASVEAVTGASKTDVYLAVSALLEAEICQVVNPSTSVAVSLAAGLDRLVALEEIVNGGT